MSGPESEHIYGVQLRESANDGSDFANGDTDYRVVFLGEDGQLHAKDSSGTVTALGGASDAADVTFDPTGLDNTAATDVQAALEDFDAAITAGGGGGGSFSSYQTLISAMSGLVHRWKFEEASGNFADSVGSLTLTKSGTITYSVSGGPVSGASGSVTIGASGQGVSSGLGSIPVAGTARTFVVIYKGKSSSSRQALLSYGTSGSTRQWWTVNLNDNGGATADALALATWGDDLAMLNSPLNVETWHMAAFGYDGTQTAFVFIDGDFYAKRLGGALNTGTGGNFFLGITTAAGDQLGGVTLDDLAVFSRALNGYELQQLYASLVGALP